MNDFWSRSSLELGRSVFHTYFSMIFFLETAWHMKAKFYVEPPWVGGTKIDPKMLYTNEVYHIPSITLLAHLG